MSDNRLATPRADLLGAEIEARFEEWTKHGLKPEDIPKADTKAIEDLELLAKEALDNWRPPAFNPKTSHEYVLPAEEQDAAVEKAVGEMLTDALPWTDTVIFPDDVTVNEQLDECLSVQSRTDMSSPFAPYEPAKGNDPDGSAQDRLLAAAVAEIATDNTGLYSGVLSKTARDKMAEGLKQRPGDQQLPVPNGTPFLHNAVCEDLIARQAVGVERYGVPLQADNGRDSSQDAYEEVLDLAVYLKQVNIEMNQMRTELVIAQDRLRVHEETLDTIQRRVINSNEPQRRRDRLRNLTDIIEDHYEDLSDLEQ